MSRSKLTRPTTDLFERDGSVLDVNDLHRHGACTRPTSFPFRRLKTFRDQLEISWPDKTKPPQVILIERTRMHFGGERPWFLCYKCGRRCAILFTSTIDVACRKCAELKFASQRQRRKARLTAKVEKIRSRLWIEGEKIIRPRYMPHAIYEKHLRAA